MTRGRSTGNFKPSHDLNPDMELNVVAIPGSHRYVATASAHHWQAYGSLIVIDPRVPDDDALAPVRRLTPDVGFPETAERGTFAYGTAWPLSEALLSVRVLPRQRRVRNLPARCFRESGIALSGPGHRVPGTGAGETPSGSPDHPSHRRAGPTDGQP